MKLKSLLKEYTSATKVYADGIQFTLIIKIDNNYCKFHYIPSNFNQLDRLNSKGKERVAKNIKKILENKLAMSIMMGDPNDAGLSFVSSVSQVEETILLLLK